MILMVSTAWKNEKTSKPKLPNHTNHLPTEGLVSAQHTPGGSFSRYLANRLPSLKSTTRNLKMNFVLVDVFFCLTVLSPHIPDIIFGKFPNSCWKTMIGWYD